MSPVNDVIGPFSLANDYIVGFNTILRPLPQKGKNSEDKTVGIVSSNTFKQSETSAFDICGGEKENQSSRLLSSKTVQSIAASPSPSEKPRKKARKKARKNFGKKAQQFKSPDAKIPNISKVFSESVSLAGKK